MAHTPGPWVIKDDLSTQPRVWRGKTLIAETGCQLPLPETEANARLIAAAPDLLAVCKLLYQCMGEVIEDQNEVAFSDLRLAIMKAEGET